ncbi:MAG: hypothetical protein EA404_05980 [Spirochaetaceae bacterium]|nr:MAG: hypothetical protein EA404_05980 [Spirochaetaceae bacterium]
MASKDRHKSPDKKAEDKVKRRTLAGRSPLLYVFSVIILVVIVVTFVGAPVATGFVGETQPVFGRYGNRDIVYSPGNYFARRFQQIAEQADISQTNQQEFQFQLRNLWRQAFNDAVFHTAVLLEAEQSGMAPSQQLLDRTLAQHPAFQEDGRFSSQRYRQMPQQERQSLRDYLREVLIQQQFVEDKLQALRTPAPETTFVASMSGPERRFQYVAFSFEEVPEQPVLDYAREFSFRFQEANLSRITVRSSQSDAERIRQQIADRTASFEDLAQAHSVDAYAEQGGEMGWMRYYELEPDFLDPQLLDEVYALDVGEVSPVLEARDTWMIYRLNEPVRQPDPQDPATLTTVRRYMSTFERGIIEDYLIDEADEFRGLAQQAGFQEAAQQLGLTVRESEWFPINYGNMPIFSPVSGGEGNLLRTAANREDFFRELFALSAGDVSPAITLQNGTLVAALIDERVPDESDMEFLRSYYPFLVQQMQGEELERSFIDRDKLTDNFNQAFARYVIGN